MYFSHSNLEHSFGLHKLPTQGHVCINLPSCFHILCDDFRFRSSLFKITVIISAKKDDYLGYAQ